MVLLFCLAAVGIGCEKAPNPSRIRLDGQNARPSETTAARQIQGMSLIPGGAFWMGCVPGDTECSPDESPRKKVFVEAYYLDVHEVTVGEYAQCVRAGRCRPPADRDEDRFCNWGYEDRDDHPVNCIDWYEAVKYCAWRGKRLPTEAEWERAARGDREDSLFPWGRARPTCEYAIMRKSVYMEDGGWGCDLDRTWPVMSKPLGKSPYGPHDLGGNVWEWCQDAYEPDWYARMPKKNPVNRTESDLRILRGGAWVNGSCNLRASSRNNGLAAGGYYGVGFRCARETG